MASVQKSLRQEYFCQGIIYGGILLPLSMVVAVMDYRHLLPQGLLYVFIIFALGVLPLGMVRAHREDKAKLRPSMLLPPTTVALVGPEAWQALQGNIKDLRTSLEEAWQTHEALGLSSSSFFQGGLPQEALDDLLRKAQEGGLLSLKAEDPLEDLRRKLEEEVEPFRALHEHLVAQEEQAKAVQEDIVKKALEVKVVFEEEEAARKKQEALEEASLLEAALDASRALPLRALQEEVEVQAFLAGQEPF